VSGEKTNMRWKIVLVVLVLLMTSCWTASALRSNFQNGWDDWSWGHDNIQDYLSGPRDSVNQFGYSDMYSFGATAEDDYGCQYVYLYPPKFGLSTSYLAFTVTKIYLPDSELYLDLYNAGDATRIRIDGYLDTGSRIELLKINQGAGLYSNGVFLGYFENIPSFDEAVFAIYISYENHRTYTYLDDFVTGGTNPNIIGTIPNYWYVMKDPTDPTRNGLYDGDSKIYSNIMHTSWGLSTLSSGGTSLAHSNIENTVYKIKTWHLQTGTVVNTTILNTSAGTSTAGYVTYNLTTMLFENPQAPYGTYIQTLYGDDEILSLTDFQYISGGGVIIFDKDQYYSEDNANIHWDIGDDYFDTSTYTYSAEIISIDGIEKTSWAINRQ